MTYLKNFYDEKLMEVQKVNKHCDENLSKFYYEEMRKERISEDKTKEYEKTKDRKGDGSNCE